MTSDDIQIKLYYNLLKKGHEYICPNKFLEDWYECDMLSVTKANFLNEYEIKISRSDFKKDFKKYGKHLYLEGKRKINFDFLSEEDKDLRKRFYSDYVIDNKSQPKIVTYDLSKLKPPNYFWYVTPEGLLKEEDIPDYAGWMEVTDKKYNNVHIRKKSKILHRDRVDDTMKLNILKSVYWRYWSLKLK